MNQNLDQPMMDDNFEMFEPPPRYEPVLPEIEDFEVPTLIYNVNSNTNSNTKMSQLSSVIQYSVNHNVMNFKSAAELTSNLNDLYYDWYKKDELNDDLFNDINKLARSSYQQNNNLLQDTIFENMLKTETYDENNLKFDFYFMDLRKQLELALSDKEIVKELIEDKKSKF